MPYPEVPHECKVQVFHLIFKNLFISCEGEHLHREALDVGWHGNPRIVYNRMEDGHMAVVTVLTAGKEINNFTPSQ